MVAQVPNLFVALSCSWKSSNLWERWQKTVNLRSFFSITFKTSSCTFLFLKDGIFLSKATEKRGVFKRLKKVCNTWSINIVVYEAFKVMPNYLFIWMFVFWWISKKKEKSQSHLCFLQMHFHCFDCLFWKAVHKFGPSGIVAPGFLEVRDNKTLLDHSVHLYC